MYIFDILFTILCLPSQCYELCRMHKIQNMRLFDFIASIIKWCIKLSKFRDYYYSWTSARTVFWFNFIVSRSYWNDVHNLLGEKSGKKVSPTYFHNIHRGKFASRRPSRRHANVPEHMLSMNLVRHRHMFRKIHGMPSKRHPDSGNYAADNGSHMCWKVE